MASIIEKLARTMALIGGAVLTALILMTCLSVLGRSLNTLFHGTLGDHMPGFSKWMLDIGVGPINGDFELVEAGVAFAIFAFLPLCQLRSGHAVVDVFASRLSHRGMQLLRAIIEVVFAAVLILIAVQLFDGTTSKYQYGETTFLLQFPVWWSYAASSVAAGIAALVGIYVAVVRILEFKTSTAILADDGTEH